MAIFFSLALSIQLCYNEVNERSDFMTNRESKAIEASELLREYCCLQRCTDCVFNFTNMKNCEGEGCMFNGVDALPSTWETHLIEKD